jgi:RNA polymerase sigma-70 factor (ECF subfamily)
LTKSSTQSDHELLIAIRNGNTEAFEILYFRYFASLCRFAFKKLQNETIVEELVQDVFVDLWKKRNELNTEGEVVSLLYAMLRNKALHELRAKMIQSRHIEEFRQLHKDDQAIELTEQLYASQIQEQMKRAIEKLSPQCRQAFTLSRYEHLSYKEIAEKMKISVNTVEKHIGKALHLLRQEFKEYNIPILLLIGMLELALK